MEDRRGVRLARGGSKLSIGVIVIGVIYAVVTGQNPLMLLGAMLGNQGSSTQQVEIPNKPSAAENEMADFSTVVLASTEDVWTSIYQSMGRAYEKPAMVLFDGQVQSGCGVNSEAVGPFYCPADKKVYLSLSFYRQLEKLGAPGDFARAYVIGHEVGHHIQNISGINAQVRQQQQRARSQAEANQWSVRMELQADCLAGVWAHHANKQQRLLEPGDVEEGLQAAASIGDDTLQKRSGRGVNSESFTHGSAEQRVQWLKRGLQTGNMDACDTYSG